MTDETANFGTVQSIHVNLRTRQPMESRDRVAAVAGSGLSGCRHSKPGNDRAVLLVAGETLDTFGLKPAEIKENLTTRGIDLTKLSVGAQLQVGASVILEITGPCAPCRRMDEIRQGLKAELAGRRGMNARVLNGGDIETGDEIRIVRAGRSLPK